jgi:hypothetical protein
MIPETFFQQFFITASQNFHDQGFKNWNSTGFQNRQKPIDKPKELTENRLLQ